MLLLLLVAILQTAVLATMQPALKDYQARLKTLKRQIPAVVASAQQAADTLLAHPDALVNTPYWVQTSFSEEMINRAGGLAHAYPTEAPDRTKPTEHDVVLLTVRSWEKQADLIRKNIKDFKAKGWTVTIIGSAKGKPADLGADFFIDNGAPTGKAECGRINLLANLTLGWMWCCEYGGAMSRKGKFPAVLYSVAMPGADTYDAKIQTPEGRHTIVDCPQAIPAGALAKIYLKRIEKMVKDVESHHVQGQLAKAADVVAARMAAGGTVGLAGMGHAIIEEVKYDNQAPWKAFQAVGSVTTAFKTNLKPGDLLVWMTYCGMNSKYDDYAKYIAEAKVDLITCYAPDPVWSKDPPPTLAHIDQGWQLPDAEVPIPVFPHVMAPISGINVTLLMRMLDDEVAARLEKMKKK